MSRISYRTKENGTDHFELYFEDLIPETQTKLLQFIQDNNGDISIFKKGMRLVQFHSQSENMFEYSSFENVKDSDIDQGTPWR